MRLGIFVAILLVGSLQPSNSRGQAMNDPRADFGTLVGSLMPLAEQMLAAHGEFFPFGGAMRPDGQIVSIAGSNGNERPKSLDVIASMKNGLVASARKNEYKATAIFYDTKITLSLNDDKSDAVAISLNHRDQYSVIIFFPYKVANGEVIWGEAITRQGEADIFPTQ